MIFGNKLKELESLKFKYDINYPIKEFIPNNTRIQEDREIEELIPSFNKLKEWSGKQKCSVIFDSEIDGDGGNNVLKKKVFNKSQLYFLSFDYNGNVYGGYLNSIIKTEKEFIVDPNAFVFSLIRNGKLKNMKYPIKSDQQHKAFKFGYFWLYSFGWISTEGYLDADIFVNNTNSHNSSCEPSCYSYNGEQFPFVDQIGQNYQLKRILVIQMK